MKKIFSLLIFITCINLNGQDFDNYFTGQVLRFDFMFAGNSDTTMVFPLEMSQESCFAGSKNKLIDPFNYGNFRYEVYDLASDKLIYSRGFCTLFQEWQTTAEAMYIDRSFHEVATMPFPKEQIRFVIGIRQRNGLFTELYETTIDPADYFIIKEQPVRASCSRIVEGGDPSEMVDIVFIAEGYTAGEMEKFRNDVESMSSILFDTDPYSGYINRFNIWAVEAVSQESGTDIPGENIYRNTALNSTFYTFDIERYLTTYDLETVNDYAGLVPHDNIIILVNTDKYGGGGVYNYYSITAADNWESKRVFVHELGHSFAGLADEYYTSDVAYIDFYPLDVEPWEPNISTLVDFDKKWKEMIGPETPSPTPDSPEYDNVVGLFEGGGYSSKGIYRPELDCTMKSNTNEGFCEVCRKAITEMIEFYSF